MLVACHTRTFTSPMCGFARWLLKCYYCKIIVYFRLISTQEINSNLSQPISLFRVDFYRKILQKKKKISWNMSKCSSHFPADWSVQRIGEINWKSNVILYNILLYTRYHTQRSVGHVRETEITFLRFSQITINVIIVRAVYLFVLMLPLSIQRPTHWSRVQSVWLLTMRLRIRVPAIPQL